MENLKEISKKLRGNFGKIPMKFDENSFEFLIKIFVKFWVKVFKTF